MAEVILPPEELEPEIPEEQLPEVDKPTELSKVITVKFNPLDTGMKSTANTRQSFYTTDTDAWIVFEIENMDAPNGEYSLVLYNKSDGSVFQRTGDIVKGAAYYKIEEEEIKHAGEWLGQVVITLVNGKTTTSRFSFNVAGHLLDGKDVRQIVIQDFETLMKQLNGLKDDAEIDFRTLKNDIEESQRVAEQNELERLEAEDERKQAELSRKENYNSKVDAAIVEADVVTKVDDKVAELSPTIQNVTAQLAHNRLLRINFLNEGGKVNDESYDSTPLLQELDSRVSDYGHVEIDFPPGKYYFKGTYIQSEGVTLKGASEFETWNQNGKLGFERGTVFFHVPVIPRNFLTLSQENLKSGYVAGGSIQGLYIVGNELSNIALDLAHITNGNYKNILTFGFETGIQLISSMKTTFTRVGAMNARKHGLNVPSGVSTTTRFYDCYLGQSRMQLESKPIKIASSTVLGFDFYSCIIESTAKGLDLGSGNNISFMNLYTENVPADISTGEPIIKMGIEETSKFDKGIYSFIGGNVSGTNGTQGFHVDNKVVEIGEHVDSVLFAGIKFARGNRLIDYHEKAKSITFLACSSIQVTDGITVCNKNGKLNILGSFDASKRTLLPTELNDLVQKTPTGSYRIRTRNTATEADLSFETNGETTISFDSKGNTRQNFTGNPINVKKSFISGAIERPDFTSLSSSIKVAVVWAEDVDGVTRMRVRASNGNISNIGVPSTGTRPTKPYNGEQIYDNSLTPRIPIWYDGSTGTWRDAMGNSK